MSSKPMTEYINHKYPVAEKPIQSVLTHTLRIDTPNSPKTAKWPK